MLSTSTLHGTFYVDVRKYPMFEGMTIGRQLRVRATEPNGTVTYAESEVVDVDAHGFTVRVDPREA